jgi:AraC family transcriptional regulator
MKLRASFFSFDSFSSCGYSKKYQCIETLKPETRRTMQTHYCLAKVLDYIEAHLLERLELEELADVANYSPWHFHRLFTSIIGMGVGEYIRRRRMSEACRELVFTIRPISAIARRYQFNSQAAFTRAMKALCGNTPGSIRSQMGPLTRFSPVNLIQYARHYRKGAIMLSPRFEHKDAFTVVGIARQFNMSNNTIPLLWNEFNQRREEIKHAICEAAVGVCYYDSSYNSCPDKAFTYMAGYCVSSADDLPEGMVSRTIPACEFAVFEHRGALDTLQQTYDHIFREWMPTSEYEMVEQDDFEWYDDRFEFGASDSIMEIWIPVKKKS